MIRRPLHRSDANQSLIVSALRKAGVKVEIIGEPLDLLTGYKGVLRLIEVKDGDRPASERKLRQRQKDFMRVWEEFPVYKVETIQEAFAAHGIEVA